MALFKEANYIPRPLYRRLPGVCGHGCHCWSLESYKFILIVEAKKVLIKGAKKQFLLAFKDMGNRNCSGVIYRFVTVSDIQQMLCYQNSKFSLTEDFHVVLCMLEVEIDKWMQELSVIINLTQIHMKLKSMGPTRASEAV